MAGKLLEGGQVHHQEGRRRLGAVGGGRNDPGDFELDDLLVNDQRQGIAGAEPVAPGQGGANEHSVRIAERPQNRSSLLAAPEGSL